ncbi:TolC family protein [Halarsenatibacter silvermanii]|uniref:Outer membrane protein TolC n=1 Tax=Halarsenatibacter silvermanii TaxID=321763 RepID=A0A1G9SJ81_9FIRM|nr:TolC family protein [Halarsenatibacter silvermanii]SDM35543.1 Outer membrane protein TolC [Halarsenatibacter silvermanii]
MSAVSDKNCFHYFNIIKYSAVFLIAGILLLGFSLSAQGAETETPAGESITLAESIELALEQNWGLMSAREELRSQEPMVDIAESARYPDIDFSTSYSRFDETGVMDADLDEEQLGQLESIEDQDVPTIANMFEGMDDGQDSMHSTEISLQQPIYTFGRISSGIESAEAALRAGEAGFTDERQDLIHDVITAYHNVILAEEMVGVQKDHREAVKSHKEVVEANLEAGMVTELDLYEARVALSEIEQELVEAESDLKLARNQFRSVLGLPETAQISPADEPQDSLEGMEDEALKLSEKEERIDLADNPQLEELSHQLEASQADTEAAEAERYPDIALSGSYSLEDDDFGFDESSWSVAVSVGLDVFDGGQTRAEIEQAEAESRQLEHAREDMRSQLEVEYERAFNALSDALSQEDLAFDMREEAEKRVELAELRYAEGVGTSTDVLDARAEESQARLARKQAEYSRIEAISDVYRVLGHVDKLFEEVN